MRNFAGRLLLAMSYVLLASCSGNAESRGDPAMKLELTSPEFTEGGTIPARFTCTGENVSPRLEWLHVPEGTKTLALICDDPDAPMGTWVHWVLYGMPAGRTSLPEDVARDGRIESVGTQGRNDFGTIGYGGPCPPPGKPHRYFFRLYALDADPGLRPGAKKADLEKAMKGHVLAQGQLVGRFGR